MIERFFLKALVFLILTATSGAWAATTPENPVQNSYPTDPSAVSENTPKSKSTPKNMPKKGKMRRENQAEGTQARKSFDTDINTKSKYQYDGQSLEVDTD